MTTRPVLRSTAMTDQVANADEGSASAATRRIAVFRMAEDCILTPMRTAHRAPTPPQASVVSPILAAHPANPRFGKWKLTRDPPPPALNIMTYEPWGDGG